MTGRIQTEIVGLKCQPLNRIIRSRQAILTRDEKLYRSSDFDFFSYKNENELASYLGSIQQLMAFHCKRVIDRSIETTLDQKLSCRYSNEDWSKILMVLVQDDTFIENNARKIRVATTFMKPTQTWPTESTSTWKILEEIKNGPSVSWNFSWRIKSLSINRNLNWNVFLVQKAFQITGRNYESEQVSDATKNKYCNWASLHISRFFGVFQ